MVIVFNWFYLGFLQVFGGEDLFLYERFSNAAALPKVQEHLRERTANNVLAGVYNVT